jgi:hypothetical protein
MSASELQPQEIYTPEEVQQILHLAIARTGDRGELSREQLVEIATELDIDANALQLAEQDWLSQRHLNKKRLEFNVYRRDILKQKAIRYLIVNGFLITIDFISGGALSWSIYLLLLWGLGLSLDTWKTFQSKGEAYELAFQRWNLKNEMKQSVTSFWNWLKKTWQSTPTSSDRTVDDW